MNNDLYINAQTSIIPLRAKAPRPAKFVNPGDSANILFFEAHKSICFMKTILRPRPNVGGAVRGRRLVTVVDV